MDDPTSFGAWLRKRRKACDLTQTELARRVGCVEGTIRKFEADELRPSRGTAARLAAQLGLPPAEHAAFIAFARAQAGAQTPRFPTLAGTTSLKITPTSFPQQIRHNLPDPPTTLIGREQEVAAAAVGAAGNRV